MIVQSSPNTSTSVPIKIVSQPVSSGIQIVRKSAGASSASQQPQRVLTQLISPTSSNNPKQFILKQEGGQQIILASSSKDEPGQYIPQSRGNITITRTSNAHQGPTILNTKAVQKPAPPSITVKQIRSPPLATTQNQTILNKSASPNTNRVILNQQQRVVKMPTNFSGGTLQAVNIPGKGVQYVRVLNSQAPSNVTITPRTVASQPKKIINSTLSPTNPTSRVLVPGKTTGTYTLVQAGGSQVRTVQRASPALATNRLSSSPQKLIAVVKKEKDAGRPVVCTLRDF